MKVTYTFVVLVVLAVSALAAPMVDMEVSTNWKVPSDWHFVGKPSANDMLKVQIAIKQSNLDVLEVCHCS
jgi:hypothetical protein